MKTAGIIGGMSWESTVPYYAQINEGIRDRLGGLHSAPILLRSVDFAPLAAMQKEGRWEEIGGFLAGAALSLERAGADFVVLASNTMHKVADAIEGALSIPFLHIADAAGERVLQAGMKRVGLLGTAFTMEQGFYSDRLLVRYGIETLVPEREDRRFIHETIYTELCCGVLSDEARERFLETIKGLVDQGAEGIVLGCTEIPLLVTPSHTSVPLFDTGRIHTAKVVEWMVEG